MTLMLQARTATLGLLVCHALFAALTVSLFTRPWCEPHILPFAAIATLGSALFLLAAFIPPQTPSIAHSKRRAMSLALPFILVVILAMAACSPSQTNALPFAVLITIAAGSGVVFSEVAVGPPIARLLAALPKKGAVLVVGNNRRTRELVGRWLGEAPGPVDIVGYMDAMDLRDPMVRNPLQDSWPFLGDVSEIASVVSNRVIDEVWITLPVRSRYQEIQNVVAVCEDVGLPVRVPTGTFSRATASIRRVDGKDVNDVYYLTTLGRPWQLLLKRAMDIIGAGILLLLLAPLFLAVAAAIKLNSRGPVFFRQTRCGLHGRRFTLLKFRSMVDGAASLQSELLARNEVSGPVFKIKRDPRITAVGRFLRKTSLDELPQFINVIRGDMSLVGPRPPVPSEVAKYEPWQRRRLSVLPGITCTWQVSGRSEIPFERWMELDLAYAANWSVTSDLMLLARTIPAVLSGRGAS
jgi:exopolysaccharide biosynthesis polyprenyl glycosylphosphotransferase